MPKVSLYISASHYHHPRGGTPTRNSQLLLNLLASPTASAKRLCRSQHCQPVMAPSLPKEKENNIQNRNWLRKKKLPYMDDCADAEG